MAGGAEWAVNYELTIWGTFENDKLCSRERNGALEGTSEWPSGVAMLQMESGEERRILLRKSGTFAICE